MSSLTWMMSLSCCGTSPSPFDIHCGDYVRIFNGYRQRTGPFRISWCRELVQQKILHVDDPSRRAFLQQVYDLLIMKQDSCDSRFILMHFQRERPPFLYEIFSSPLYRGVECALWPALYHKTSLCESMLEGQDNRASGKIAFMHKVLSPVHDFALNFDILQYQYDRWLFKTITGAVNASKASGCSPNRSLETKSFSKKFWQHQNLYLIDAVRQYGYPSFFITISPYEWTFPFPPFLEEMRSRYFKDVTDIPTIETIHIAHVLEQIARGYLTGGNCNRWRTNVFTNLRDPTSKNLETFFLSFRVPETGHSPSSHARVGEGHFSNQSTSPSCLSALGECRRRLYRSINTEIGQVISTRTSVSRLFHH